MSTIDKPCVYKGVKFYPYGMDTGKDTFESIGNRILRSGRVYSHLKWDFEEFYAAAKAAGVENYSVFKAPSHALLIPCETGLYPFRIFHAGGRFEEDEPFMTKGMLLAAIKEAASENEHFEYSDPVGCGAGYEMWDISFDGKIRTKCIYTLPDGRECNYGPCTFIDAGAIGDFIRREVGKA